MELEKAVDAAMTAFDAEYLAAERVLFAAPADALRLLAKKRDDDPTLTTLTSVLFDAVGERNAAFEDVDRFLDGQEVGARGTPMRLPVPESIADMLRFRHGAGLDAFLAWRLVKQRALPQWRAVAFLRYCAVDREPSALPALVRFVATTGDAFVRGVAQRILAKWPGLMGAILVEAASRGHIWKSDLTGGGRSVKSDFQM